MTDHNNTEKINNNINSDSQMNVDSEVKVELADNHPKEESENKEPEGEPITGLVNQDLVKQLIEMGFSKNVSEKSLFLNQGILDKAIEWIYENQDQPDFEEELRLIGKEHRPTNTMTPDEIKAKAKELQEYARKKFIQKEKERAEEAEKTRIRVSKKLIY